MGSARRKVQRADVVVVGAGPAGLAAGIHLARARVCHVVLGLRLGGLLRSAGLVECYPGFPGGIPAEELVDRMVRQAHSLGVELQQVEVSGLRWTGQCFRIDTQDGRWEAPTVILATGTVPRPLAGIAVGAEVDPARIAYETADLPAVLSGQRVLVSGAGDAAFDGALQLVGRGAAVSILMRGERPRALELLVERALAAGVELRRGHRVVALSLRGPQLLATVEDAGGARRELEIERLLVCHGREPAMDLWHGLAGNHAGGSQQVETRYPGLFLAGDLVRGSSRYVAVAVGDGQRCARLAEAQLERYRAGSPNPPVGIQ